MDTASAGTNQPFSVFLQSGSNTFESSLFTNGLQPDQVYSFSNVPVSLQNNEGCEDLYFAIKYNGSDRLSLTDASLSVTYTAVPEPTSSALAALASLGLLAGRRRTV